MGKYVYAYKGGGMPESEEEGKRIMEAWTSWFGGLGDSVVDMGNPFGASAAVGGGSTSGITGYSIVTAGSLDDALAKAEGCPDPRRRQRQRRGVRDDRHVRRRGGGRGANSAPPAAASTLPRVDARPIGVFDSGAGGLTVLHECLVTMPHEDFVYLGDGARLPYGPRPLDEIRRFAGEIAGYLERQGVKLVVAACNSATAAALPDLQRALSVPGARRDPARGARGRARHAQPSRRPARDRGDRRERPLRGADLDARCRRHGRARRLPEARAADRGRRPLRRGDRRGGARGRRAAEGGRGRHRRARLHALPADPADPAARVRPRRHARLLRRRDGARGVGDARPQGDRERRRRARAPTAS